jgi:predicted pyridoxine 5'-phosphate oxidase superfamily flavin-nucleotide-binding protein
MKVKDSHGRMSDSHESLGRDANPMLHMGIWHEGEIAVQERAGVRDEAEELTGMYRAAAEPGMAGFLGQQRFAVITAADSAGRTWISAVAGEPGMIDVPDPRIVRLNAPLIETTLPVDDLRGNPKVGMLVIDFVRRIRVRINGEASVQSDGSIVIGIRQLYGNCSQYIQRRTVIAPAASPHIVAVATADQLNASQQELIAHSDTFFLGSVHPESGADASHRGGLPGFVRVDSPAHLSFPDYSGNKMFNTLGNIEVNPSVGLLFFDFDSGRSLQLTGRASVDWGESRAQQFKGAQRVIDVAIDEVREVPEATALRYRFEAYSPFLTQE